MALCRTLLAGLFAGHLAGVSPAAAQTAPATPALSPTLSPRNAGLEIRAQLTPRQSTILSSELAGRIEAFPLREGDRFEEGQQLAAFDCAMHRAQLARATAQQTEARKTYEVNQRLARLNSISALEVDVAAARLAAAEAETAIMRIAVSRCTIRAPFQGRVAAVRVRQHQFATAGQELLEILDDRDFEVEMIVPSRWLAWLRPGTAFTLAVDETSESYPAEVTRLAARIDPVSQSVTLFGKVTTGAGRLIAGMSGRALFSPPQP